ncbi:hypothetical protein PHYSODRAFT_419234, partial [Phytophthora sojae]
RIKKTIYQVRTVETTGNLFQELCRTQTETGTIQLLDYNPDRFLSLATATRRILDKWTAIRMCQAEEPNQVNVLHALYLIRLNTLDLDKPLKHYMSTKQNPKFIAKNELTDLAQFTRERLRKTLDSRFFSRYYKTSGTQSAAFVFEMQSRLHPTYKRPDKSLNRVVKLCCIDNGHRARDTEVRLEYVSEKIKEKFREILTAVAEDQFSCTSRHTETQDLPRSRVDDELNRWNFDETPIGVNADGEEESVLEFWRRMEQEKKYQILPRAAKLLFAVPTSSAHIERDFSVAGSMVTPQRTRITQRNVDMGIFLNRNRTFVDLTQCEEIPSEKLASHVPSSMSYPIE